MANAIYPLYKKALLDGSSDSALSGSGTTGLYAALVSSSYTYNSAHQFYSSLSGVIGTDQEVTSVTTTAGVVDGADTTHPSVASGTAVAIVLYRKNAGANTTWRLVAYLDTGVTGLPVTANGGNINTTWNASGIFGL